MGDLPSSPGKLEYRLSKVEAQGTLSTFLGISEIPTCVKAKCKDGNSACQFLPPAPLPGNSSAVRKTRWCVPFLDSPSQKWLDTRITHKHLLGTKG